MSEEFKGTIEELERLKMVKAMEFIMRQLNDEIIFGGWLAYGVADGDIEYGDLSVTNSDIVALGYYINKDELANLMDEFVHNIRLASRNGGLFCAGVVGGDLRTR